jgi:hypothetical protein
MSFLSNIGKTLSQALKKGTGQRTDLAALLNAVGQVADKNTTKNVVDDLVVLRIAVAIAAVASPKDPHVQKATRILSDAIEALK